MVFIYIHLGDFEKKMNFNLNKPPENQKFDTKMGEPSHISDSEEELIFDSTEFLKGILESDLEIEEKLFIPIIDRDYNNCYKKPRLTITIKSLKLFKRKMIANYGNKMRNGFYTGFIACVICRNCLLTLDAFPCYNKRTYWCNKDMCCYCKKITDLPSTKDYEYFAKQEYIRKKDMKHWDVK